MQSAVAVGFAGVAFFIPTTLFLKSTLAFFWLIAFSSATHDIAADGFYMLALTQGEQSFFVGIRNTFYRFATIFGQGLLVMLAGYLEEGKIIPRFGREHSDGLEFVFLLSGSHLPDSHIVPPDGSAQARG